ncbi:MAG: hypothetical protein ACKVWV_16885 [Planctomycetota bacterium]
MTHAKPVIACTLLAGVALVWTPKLTGFDPLGMLPDEPGPNEPVIGRTAPPAPRSLDSSEPSEPDGEAQQLAPETLDAVVRMLDLQLEGPKTIAIAPAAAEVAPIPVTHVVSAPIPREDPIVFVAESEHALDEFLRHNPLHAIVRGNGLATATFGLFRVAVGDVIGDSSAEVIAIEHDAVVLRSADKTVRVPLPPCGSRTARSSIAGTTEN